MNIAVVNNQAPFVRGGAELLAEWLTSKFQEHGHSADLIRIPFRWNPPQKILDNMLAARLIAVRNVDRVIALKFPAYYVQHEHKVLWLLHQFRQAYELRGTSLDDLGGTREADAIAESVARADNAYLRQAKHIFTNSSVVSDRLLRYNGIESEVLYPPLLEVNAYECRAFQDFVFYPSRLTRGKRQELLVEAMAHVRSDVRLVLAGSPDAPAERERLLRRIAELGVGDRVELLSEWISEERKRALFADALACAYVPFDEDSYGYVSLESYYSRKPVITCSDSGGTLEVVEDGLTGRVVEPEPEALAAAMDGLRRDPGLARRMGEAGYERLQAMNISWDHVIDRLLA